jgi:hypothetical protein
MVAAGLALDRGGAREMYRSVCAAFGRDRKQTLDHPGSNRDQPWIVVTEAAGDEPGMQAIGGNSGPPGGTPISR